MEKYKIRSVIILYTSLVEKNFEFIVVLFSYLFQKNSVNKSLWLVL